MEIDRCCFTCEKAFYDHPLAMKVRPIAEERHTNVAVVATSDIRFCSAQFNFITLIGVTCWRWRAKEKP